jgi:hypothetical protein
MFQRKKQQECIHITLDMNIFGIIIYIYKYIVNTVDLIFRRIFIRSSSISKHSFFMLLLKLLQILPSYFTRKSQIEHNQKLRGLSYTLNVYSLFHISFYIQQSATVFPTLFGDGYNLSFSAAMRLTSNHKSLNIVTQI